MRPLSFWQRLGRAAQGPYFIAGSSLLALLILAAVLGPDVAPHNPFLVKRLQWIGGELRKAPFPPSALYPLGTDDLGRDQLSLLLHGARVTLVMAFVATVVRLLLGLMLGTIAGWRPGSLFDRMVCALTDFLAAIPGLILALLVIYAVGIRRGQVAFVAALSAVGWGEITQIVRGHVLSIRNRLYILAARAVGLSAPSILSRHVLPNLLPTSLALAALEMGSVLLLLGELGFLQVFIGGGRTGFDMSTWQAHHYFDVPDWGAMLGSSWRWFRSYPWLPLAPALAFFVAVLGFNLFGYGLQRFIERGRFHPTGWSVVRVLLVVGVLLLAARTLLQSTGIEAQVARLVRQFDAARAWNDAAYLAQPQLEGRPTGPGGGFTAAAYIAHQFERAQLSSITAEGSYFQPYTAIRGRITALPSLEVLDSAGEVRARLTDGISLDPYQAFHAEGESEAELVVMGNTKGTVMRSGILLLLDPEEELRMPWNVPPSYSAVLRMVSDSELAQSDHPPSFDRGRYAGADSLPSFPNILITQSAARRVLEQAGLDLEELQAQMAKGDKIVEPAAVRVRLRYGLLYEEIPATNVVGYIPGLDQSSEGERILVAATYSGPLARDGITHPGADENASGVAVMLETARLLSELELIPKRTVVFAAFDEGGGYHFADSPALPTERSDVWTAVIVHGVGAGDARLARMEAGSGPARSFDQSARRFRVRTQQLGEWPFFFVSNYSRLSNGEPSIHEAYQALAVSRPGDELSGTPEDTLDHLDREALLEAGKVVAHYVMVLASR